MTFSAFCDILSVETGFILGSVSGVLFRASALDDGEVTCFLFVELLPFVSDVPARVSALADGVRPPLFVIQALFNVSAFFFSETSVIAVTLPPISF